MSSNFCKMLNITTKHKEEILDVWNSCVNQHDDFIVDFLKRYGIEMEFIYSTNVDILNIETQTGGTILWDISYWGIYRQYLDFIFWMEQEKKDCTCEPKFPLELKENAYVHQNKPDAYRVLVISNLFQYLAYKFYSDVSLSYCFALLYNENKCVVNCRPSEKEMEQWNLYISDQLLITKLFCAFHEAYHLKMLPIFGEYKEYQEHVLYNLRGYINSESFKSYYEYDLNLVQNVRNRINYMDNQDPLLDELFADACALDFIDFVVNRLNIIQPKWSLNKFALVTKEVIENFYAFNTLTYELYESWNLNMRLNRGDITKVVYKEEFHMKDTEDVIRSQIFPLVLWGQIDLFSLGYNQQIQMPIGRHVNVRKEMINLYRITYNDRIKKAVISATNNGFKNGRLKIQEARDILIDWQKLDTYKSVSEKDLFLEGGIINGIDFFMFARGY